MIPLRAPLRRPLGAAVFALMSLTPALASAQAYPEGLYAEFTTTKGRIVAVLDFVRTPMTVASFVGLAEGTIDNDAFPAGTPFFDGSVFDRVVPGHVIQGGQADSDASRGAGYRIPNEIHPYLDHGRAGMLGMANGGPHTGSNVFYITLGDRSYLDGDYTVFGEVREGLDVVLSITQGDVMERVRIVRVGEEAHRFRPTTALFRSLVEDVERQVRDANARQAQFEQDYVRDGWPDARTGPGGWSYVVTRDGDGPAIASGERLSIRYAGHVPVGVEFASTADDCGPGWRTSGEPRGFTCTYVVGTSSIVPGLDDAIARMRRGAAWTVIVPSPVGYALRGYYAPDRPGEPRFHISPNTLLIYEVEVLR